MRFRHLFLGVLLITPPNSTQAGPSISESVRAHAKSLVEERIVPGIIIGLVDESGVTYFAQGSMTLDATKPIDEKTLFEIGSITKVFTALALCDLVEQGKMSLDDPIDQYLPDGTKTPTRGGKTITLRHLASHRSGLPRMADNYQPANPMDPYADYSIERLYAFLGSHELTRDIDSQYEYSNTGAELLGHLIARREKMSYEGTIVKHICNPLKMPDTRLELSRQQSARFSDGHMNGKSTPHWGFGELGGAGAIRSTAADLVRFLRVNMGQDKSPIDAAIKMAQAPRYETGGPEMHVALGWHVLNRHGTEIIWHNGGTFGFHSFIGFRTDKKLGVVVLANASHDIDHIGVHLLNPKNELTPVRRAVSIDPKLLDSYTGWYLSGSGPRFEITRDGDALFARLTGQDAYPIYPASATTFFYRVVEAELEFDRDKDGKCTALTLNQNGAKHRYERAPADYTPPREIELDAATMANYVGKYQLVPGVFFLITERDGGLNAQITGQPALPIYPSSKSNFFYKAVDAQITFLVEDGEQATALVLHQNGVDQRADRVK